MKFTKLETELLLHRLEFVDGIVEALTDCFEDEPPASRFSAEVIEARVLELEKDVSLADIALSELDNDILDDCCAGCTFFGNIEEAVDFGEISHQKATAYHNAAHTLSIKIGTDVRTS
jgi:uncharacterized protein YutD